LEERENLRKKEDKFEREKYRSKVKYYGCQKLGHIKSVCPLFKKV